MAMIIKATNTFITHLNFHRCQGDKNETQIEMPKKTKNDIKLTVKDMRRYLAANTPVIQQSKMRRKGAFFQMEIRIGGMR
jgi:hypothetical protein